MLLVFRMRGGPETFSPCPRALDPDHTYRLNAFPSGRILELTGDELAAGVLKIQLLPWGAEVVTYDV